MRRQLNAKERAEVLVFGARLLRDHLHAKFPARRDVGFYSGSVCIWEAGGVSVRFLVRFEWPGVVVVVCERDGMEVARSLPGQPFTLDPKASQAQQGGIQ